MLVQKRWHEAESLAEQAVKLAETIGRQEEIAESSWRLAKALAHQNRGAEGLPYAIRAVEIYTRLRINPEEMEKALTALRECEAGIASV